MPNNDQFAGLDDAVGAVTHQQTQDTAAQVRNNVVSAVGSNPEQESKFKHLAAFVGVPVDTVRADPAPIQQQAAVMQMDAGKLAQDFPHTANFMQDPQNVRIMHDDVPATAAVEQAVKAIPAPAKDQTPGKGVWDSLMDAPGAALRGLAGAFNKSASSLNLALGAFPSAYDKAASLITGTPTTSASDAWFRTMVDPRVNAAPAYEPDQNAGLPEKAANMAGGLLGMLSQITLSGAGGAAPAAADTTAGAVTGAVEHGVKSMALPALADAVDTGRRVYAATGDGAAAARAAQVQYMTSSAAGVVPLSAPGGIATRLAGGFVSGSVLSEASRQMMNKAMPASMQQPFSAEDLIMGGLSGAMLGGVMGPRVEPSFHEAVRQTYIDASRADTAQKTGAMVEALGQAASMSKLRERDPEAFRQFVANVTEDGHLQDLYVDAREVQNALDQSGVDQQALAQRLPDLAGQLHEALQTNGDVVIPVADYATHIAGGPMGAALLPHLKAEPDGMTYKEGQQYFQGQADGVKDQAVKIAADQVAEDEHTAQSKAVYDHALGQLAEANRFPDAVNKAYASMVRDFYTTTAGRAGMTPDEMLARYPLQVKAEAMQGAKTLDQPGARPSVEDFNDLGNGYTAEGGKLLRNGAPVGDLKLDLVDDGKNAPHLVVRDLRIDSKGKGTGTEALQAIMARADAAGVPVALTTESMLGKAHQKRLRAYYERIGFVKNKGENKVAGVKEEYVRPAANTLDQSGRTIEVGGVRRPIEDSTGRPVAQDFAGQKAFYDWFGDSKAVDEQGRPLVVYHGTPTGGFADFSADSKGTRTGHAAGEVGYHFTTDPSYAEAYSEGHNLEMIEGYRAVFGEEPAGIKMPSGAAIYPAHLSLKNPMRIGESKLIDKELIDRAVADGHDGIIADMGGAQEFVAFKPEQIKSATGNDGTFDANDPNILSQAGGTRRGSLSFGDDITKQPSVITLLQHADLSTFLHESGHFFLEVLNDIASRADAPADIKADMQTTLDWFGVPDLATWNAMDLEGKRESHEKFARGFEVYLFEGKAPTPELQGLFSRFRSWLINVYQSLSNLNVTLTPEVRGVFDRLLASSEAIKQAEAMRRYEPLFKSAADAGMSDEQFAAYQALGSEATTQAVDEMQSRSLRDMRWLSNAKGKAMKAMQKEAADARAKIRDEVTKEVNAEPVNQARAFLNRKGNTDPAHGEADRAWKKQRGEQLAANLDKVKTETWESSDEFKAGEKGIKKGQVFAKNKRIMDNEAERRTLEWEKDNPRPKAPKGLPGGVVDDMIAEMFGFADGKALKKAMAGEKAKDRIDGLTDQRMLEQHGELTDPDSIERAAEAAVHNEARARFMATGLKILAKSPIPARQIERAAKEAAEAAIAAKKVADLRPAQYAAAEGRSNKEAIKLAPKDPAGAANAQRAALLNNRLFRASIDAVAEMKKAVDFLKRFDKTGTRAKIDIGIRDQIDDLLARFDLRAKVPEGPTRAQVNLATWIESQRAAGYQPAFTADMIDPAVRMHYKDMTVEQLRGLRDTVAALEHIGRERRTIVIDGKRTDVDELIKNEMIPKMQERGEKFTDAQLVDRPEDRYTNPVAIRLDKFRSQLRAIAAQLKPQEFKRNQYDNHDLLGPFGRAIFDRVFAANYHKVDMLKAMSKDYQAKVDELGHDWQKSLNDQVPNDKLVDPDKSAEGMAPTMMRITRGRMIGIAIHVGNESNFDKITKGWGWAPADVWAFLHDNMTEKDWSAVQSVWDQYEKHFPEMQAMARRLGNTSPDKIEPRPFNTKFGEMRGGYAAIKYDALRSRRGEKEQAGLAINPSDNLFNRDYFRADTTTNGSMNARVDGYTDRVDLDFHHIARSIADTIHDLAYREVLIDSNKIIENDEFRRQFKRTYGPEAYGSLRDWIGQIANSENFDRQAGALGSFLAYTRTGIVMTGISLRVSTVLKHGGSAGIKTTGYFLGGGEKFLASRFASMGTDYKNQITGAQQKFGEIRARLMQQDRDFRVTSTALFEKDPFIAKAERFGHAAVAWSDMMTAVPTAWAAYDRAITEGIPKNQGGTGKPLTEEQAVAYANKIVREAHGSNIETSRSMVLNTQSEALKMFTTLYGFMNTSYGQALDGWDKLHTAGISNPAILARSFMALIVPAIWAGFLTHGGPKDGENWASWVGKSIAVEVAGMVPFVRDAAAMVEGYSHAGQVGVESWLNTIVRAGMDTKNLAQGKEVKAPIKDIANAVGVGLHIPGMGQLGTSAQYLADVAAGKEHPQGVADVAQGVAFGPPKKH